MFLHHVTDSVQLAVASVGRCTLVKGRSTGRGATGAGTTDLKDMDSDSPIQSVVQSEASGPPCWRVQLLSQTTRRERRVFSRNKIVMRCCLGLQSSRLPSREANGIHHSLGNVSVSLFDGLMHVIIPIN